MGQAGIVVMGVSYLLPFPWVTRILVPDRCHVLLWSLWRCVCDSGEADPGELPAAALSTDGGQDDVAREGVSPSPFPSSCSPEMTVALKSGR